ncbi:MAG: hypothetical protein R2864_11375 [Syntrophotaleaceae bacterium]
MKQSKLRRSGRPAPKIQQIKEQLPLQGIDKILRLQHNADRQGEAMPI